MLKATSFASLSKLFADYFTVRVLALTKNKSISGIYFGRGTASRMWKPGRIEGKRQQERKGQEKGKERVGSRNSQKTGIIY